MRQLPVRAWLALMCVGATLTCGAADAAAAKATPDAKAQRVLTREGFDDVRVACRARRGRATRCTWNAIREQSSCSGTLYVDRRSRRGRWVRLRAPQCSEVLFGFNTYTNDITNRLQRQTGATVRRLIVPWSNVERAPGAWTWQEFDQEYKLALEAGLRPIIIAVSAPCWARVRSGCVDTVYNGPPDEQNEPDWRDYIARLVERYPKALGIEIWNEPNLTQVFAPRPDPERYTRLLKIAYETIKARDPAMPVVSGGLLANDVEGEGAGGMGDRTFVQRMMAAGAGRFMDAIGIHPYPEERLPGGGKRWNPAIAQQTLEHLHAIAAAAGFGGLPFWITEVGESTGAQAGFPAAVSPAQQASDLVQIMRAAVRSRIVPVVVLHTLGDERADPVQTGVANVLQPATGISLFYNGVGSGFGVFDADLRAKPAACAISRELRGTLSC